MHYPGQYGRARALNDVAKGQHLDRCRFEACQRRLVRPPLGVELAAQLVDHHIAFDELDAQLSFGAHERD
jgi:hypothetical protein